jgi:hypothetical protein
MAMFRAVTASEIAACPTHRLDPQHYLENEYGCDCVQDRPKTDVEAMKITADGTAKAAKREEPL